MSNFLQMKTDLQLLGMSNLLLADIGNLLNKCQRDEVESYEWSFLYTNIVINSTPPYTTGTISLAQGSTNVTSSGAFFPTVASGWFLWVGPTQTTPVIVQSGTSTSLTLAQPWGQANLFNQPYRLQPLYYDVSPLIEVYRVRQIRLLTDTSQESLNLIDAPRTTTGGDPSIRWARAPFTGSYAAALGNSDHVQIELWPASSTALPYIVEGKLGPIDMVNDTDVPLIPTAVLEMKAMMYFARSVYASSGNPKWGQLAQMYQADYAKELEDAKTADKKRAITLGIRAGGGARRFDALVDENHDFWGPPDY